MKKKEEVMTTNVPTLFKAKEKVYVDVYETEDCYTVYFVGSWEAFCRDEYGVKALECCCTGFFYSSEGVDEWLEEREEEVEVVEDYRN